MSFHYVPDKFAALHASELGGRVWAFLVRPETVASLETASHLGRPAVEGVEERLLAAFGEDVLADRVKQMIGHMVRQVMEQRGWMLDQSEVRIRSVPFVKASRYKRPEWSTFHAFRNTRDPRDVAITDRRHEPTLPDGVRWSYYVSFASPLKASIGFGVNDLRQLERDVRETGWRRIRVERMLRRA